MHTNAEWYAISAQYMNCSVLARIYCPMTGSTVQRLGSSTSSSHFTDSLTCHCNSFPRSSSQPWNNHCHFWRFWDLLYGPFRFIIASSWMLRILHDIQFQHYTAVSCFWRLLIRLFIIFDERNLTCTDLVTVEIEFVPGFGSTPGPRWRGWNDS